MNEDLLNAKILIVDDQESNIEVLEDLLAIRGFTNIITSNDPRAVLEIAQTQKPEMILLDIMMPYLSGFDVMDQLKSAGLLTGFMPIIVLTADATIETKKKALSMGASDFLTKPFNLTEVELRIKNLLLNVYLLSQLKVHNEMLEVKVKERTLELIKSNESIQKQNEELKNIAWIQSHVVRAPLARLMGLVELLSLGESSEDLSTEDILEHISKSALELDDIIKDITLKAYQSKVFENKTNEN
ncbi:MAG: response regulator [Bacteroidota bacterium]|nr:response regulator [Bacteroidota bacterium]